MSTPTLLGGLFDRPLNPQAVTETAQDVGDQIGDCPDGFAPDILGNCQPIQGIGTSSGPVIGGGTTVNINNPPEGPDINNITNNINITDQGIQAVSDAINNAVTSAAQQASQIAQQAQTATAQAISDQVNAITTGIDNASQNILNTIASQVQQSLASVGTTVQQIAGTISSALSSVNSVLQSVLTPIKTVVDSINTEVQALNSELLQPIANLYTSTVGTISSLTVAIENDLHQGLAGLIAIPGQIAAGIGGLDATLDRTVQQIGTANAQTASDSVIQFGSVVPGPLSSAMAAALGGKVSADTLTTTFGGTVALSGEGIAQISAEAYTAIGTLLESLMNATAGTFKQTFDHLHTDWASINGIFTGLGDILLTLITTVTAIGAIAQPLIDTAGEAARKLIPTAKLDPNTVITALSRSIITTAAAVDELAAQGYDSTRAQTLIDLSVYLADINQALDWWYRGIISDQDFAANLSDHGLSNADQQAFQAGSVKLPAIDDLLRWLNFSLITQDEFTTNAKILRYDDAQIQAILSTYQQHETTEILASMQGLLNNSSIGFLTNTLSIPVPDPVSVAGARQGYHPDLVKYLWLAHWQLPQTNEFIQAFFRGIRTQEELTARLDIANIPREVQSDIVDIQRPLIPFRSLAAFVKAGAMSQSDAQGELGKHGFDTQHLNWVSDYLFPKTSAVTATAAVAVHTLSIANARALWGEGALTDLQYTAILEAHGYTADMAALQLKADAITEHLKQQKQAISDATAQVEAGQLTLEDAVSQLSQQGLTQAQISKFQITVTKALAIAVKHPTLAQMESMIKAGLLTLAAYTTELQAQGWADPWLTNLVALQSGNVPTSSSTATS